MKVLIPFYSLYGHIYKMAQAVAEARKTLYSKMELVNYKRMKMFL